VATIGIDNRNLQADMLSKSFGLVEGWWPICCVLHTLSELGELLLWLFHDDKPRKGSPDHHYYYLCQRRKLSFFGCVCLSVSVLDYSDF